MMKIIANAPIGVKVALAPAFALLCLVFLALSGWWSTRSLMHAFDQVSTVYVPRLQQAQELGGQFKDLQRLVMQSLSWEAAGQKAERIAELDKRITTLLRQFDGRIKQAADEPGLAPQELQALQSLRKQYDVYFKTALETLDIKSAGVSTAASFLFTLDAAYADGAKSLDELSHFEQAQVQAAQQDAAAQARSNNLTLAIAAALALAIASWLTLAVMRAIVQPLSQAVQMARTVAEGDLTGHEVHGSTDATGRMLAAMNDMQAKLLQLIGRVRLSADSIAVASSEIAGGNANLSHRTEQQAAALQQTAASMQQMTETVQRNADTARQASQLAGATVAVADRGGQVVGRVVQTMEQISASSRRISDIIGTINGIAFQTNILALNAAVEAARAGEQGRGFAVVAGEVRGLAQRSAEAAREIKQLITESVSQVQAGSQLVGEAGGTMNEIVSQVRRVTDLISEIDAATAEQTTGITQVNKAVESLDQGTQQNAALVEQSAAAAESLKQQADELQSLVAVFRVRREAVQLLPG